MLIQHYLFRGYPFYYTTPIHSSMHNHISFRKRSYRDIHTNDHSPRNLFNLTVVIESTLVLECTPAGTSTNCLHRPKFTEEASTYTLRCVHAIIVHSLTQKNHCSIIHANNLLVSTPFPVGMTSRTLIRESGQLRITHFKSKFYVQNFYTLYIET